VLDGVLKFTENGVEKCVGKGEYYVQQSGLQQGAASPSESPSYYYIHAHLDVDDCDSPYLPIRGTFDRASVLPHIERLEAAKSNPNDLIGINAAFLNVLASLSEGSNTRNRTVLDIADYISAHASEHVTLADVCKRYGYCKNYINMLFKRELGFTVHEYLTERRILAVKGLLMTSNLSLEEIADQTGFDTYINLYKAFLKREGVSPGEFRRRFTGA
jgi:AraC-like DNA-binding protein